MPLARSPLAHGAPPAPALASFVRCFCRWFFTCCSVRTGKRGCSRSRRALGRAFCSIHAAHKGSLVSALDTRGGLVLAQRKPGFPSRALHDEGWMGQPRQGAVRSNGGSPAAPHTALELPSTRPAGRRSSAGSGAAAPHPPRQTFLPAGGSKGGVVLRWRRGGWCRLWSRRWLLCLL